MENGEMETVNELGKDGDRASIECPKCHTKKIWKRGFDKKYSPPVQRYECPKCDESFREKSNKVSYSIRNRQLCAMFEAKKLDTATETKTVVGDGKTQQETKGKILEFCLYLKRQNYSDETIRLNRIALKVLSDRGANLFDSDSVKDVIAKQTWSSSRKKNVIIAYTNFLKINKMTWEPPRCIVTQPFPFIPTEQEIDSLISAAPPKLSTFLLLLKETAMRRGEAKRLEWINIDSERSTITLNNPEKNSNPRIWKVSAQLIAQLNALTQNNELVFGNSKMDSLKSAYLHLRRKQAEKLKNPRLLKIGFHTIRHWKATTLYHRTKDPLYVRDFLGHKSMKNTEKYMNIERKLFSDGESDTYTVKVTDKQHEATMYLEQGFEWLGVKDNLIFLRKRK
jgi:integrase